MGGPSSGHWIDGGVDGVEGRLDEALATEAGVALAAVRIEDPEGRPATRRAGPVAGDDHLRSLADHVPAEPEPRSSGELEAHAGRLADRTGDRGDEPLRFEHDEADPGPPGERREPAEAVGDAGGTLEARREVDDEQVHGPAGEERAGDREALLRVGRRQDHEPLRPDATRHGLDRIERLRQVEPGHDRTRGLGLGDESQRERRPAARHLAPERQPEAPRQPARPEDRVELGEPGREDAGRVRRRRRRLVRRLERHCCQRPDDLADARHLGDPAVPKPPRGGRAPLRPEGRQGRRHVGGEARHRPASIEHLFE